MISVGENGELVVATGLHDGEEWLLRVRSIINLVQSVNEDMMRKEDIYHALQVLEDMLPDEECANTMWRMFKEKTTPTPP